MEYDKEYIKKLAASLNFDLDEKLLNQLVKDVNELAKTDIITDNYKVKERKYQKIINCSTMKKDEPVKSSDDVLSGCKRAEKYVVGK